MIMMFTRPIENQGVPTPTFSPSVSNIGPSQQISIEITGTAVSAEYSLDNSTWTVYTSPFTLQSSSTVYARAKDANDNYSNVISKTYTFVYDAQIEYLQTTGTQYIDTGYSPSSITPILETTIYKPSTVGSSSYVVGSDGSGNNRFSIGFLTNNRIEFRIGTYKSYSGYSAGWYTIKLDGSTGECYLDGTKKWTSTTLSYNNTYPMLLFTSYNASGTVRAIQNGVRISAYKLWDGSTLLQDMIPVRVGTTGYMYDKVSGELFGNSGSGAFTLGNDISN